MMLLSTFLNINKNKKSHIFYTMGIHRSWDKIMVMGFFNFKETINCFSVKGFWAKFPGKKNSLKIVKLPILLGFLAVSGLYCKNYWFKRKMSF